LRRELLAAQARHESSSAAAPVAAPAAAPAVMPKVTGDMTCPVAGPVSFVDSWGAPRSGGRSHEGVDMMASTGTPVAAIVSGTITLSSYGESAGNWQILSGDDGNSYWYMHNDQNIVNGGHVNVGTQIATVGGTGNASESAPHLHFEYHPGGGGPVNPYPLVASLC
ncbi:MAG TPA: M23 family metallopeptidase, partial [Actinomycetota bacterium]